MFEHRLPAAILAAGSVVLGLVAPALAAPPDDVWVQFAADGLPHVRAIVNGGSCPTLSIGARSIPLAVRSGPENGFPDTVCDAMLPAGATGAHVGAFALPAIPKSPTTIAMFGDSGCRLKGKEVQACNDPAGWPFPTVAKDIAAAHPDLVIHVGDYYYRESPCPAGVNCTGSPHGDNAASWNADWFAPMTPVFAAAPLVLVRGNHEDCTRSPLGWARYLSGVPVVACLPHEPVAFVSFDNLLVGEVDDSLEVTETLDEPAVYLADEAQVDAHAAAANRESWLIVHRPPVAYEATHENAPNLGPHLAAVISGHIHTFGAYTLPGEPPQAIVGVGGDNLAAASELTPLLLLGGVTDRRFGYALFVRTGNGWDVTVHDTDTAVHRRCRLEARTLSCGPALTKDR
jgi:hypothetical protein